MTSACMCSAPRLKPVRLTESRLREHQSLAIPLAVLPAACFLRAGGCFWYYGPNHIGTRLELETPCTITR